MYKEIYWFSLNRRTPPVSGLNLLWEEVEWPIVVDVVPLVATVALA